MGYTPLYYAVISDKNDLVEFLIARGADIKAKDRWGYTLLHCAVFPISWEGIEMVRGSGKLTPGYLYGFGNIEKCNKVMVELLIGSGADVNAKDNEGITTLHWAVVSGQKEIVKILLEKGADVNAKTNNGKTPLGLAIQKNNKEIIDLLKEHGAVE